MYGIQRLFLLGCVSLPLLSCADLPDEEAQEGPLDLTTTVLGRVQRGQDVFLLPSSSSLKVDLLWGLPSDRHESSIELTLEIGKAALAATQDGSLEIQDLDLQIADVKIDNQSLAPMFLTDLRLHQTEAVMSLQTEWNEDFQMGISWATVPLALDWSIQTPQGELFPLGSQVFHVPLFVALEQGEDGIFVQMILNQEGPLWKWGGLLALQNLKLNLANR